MKNIIIHPEDNTTTFLKPIYEKIKDQIVITSNSTPEEISSLIKTSNRVIMLGHGSSMGLFALNVFPQNILKPYVIGSEEKEILKDKTENIYIWCNANKYVEYYNLKGFYSGMFISEIHEAILCGLKNITQEIINESNNEFSAIVGKHIDLPVKALHETVKKEYGELAKINPVAEYNYERLYVK